MIVVDSARADDDDHRPERQGAFLQTNLVSNVKTQGAPTIDPRLQNPWGIAWIFGGPLWVANNADDSATAYTDDGNIVKVKGAPVTVTIPPLDKSIPFAPTGLVSNCNPNQFLISGTNFAAEFISDGEGGGIAAWRDNQSTATIVRDNSASGAVYKGLALGNNTKGSFLFATNFHAGTVEVFTTKFQPTTLKGSFYDPDLPPHYAPFGIANIGGDLIVTYARQDDAKHDDVPGDGLGFVDVFNTNGELIRRLVSRDPLNAPWGIARAPTGFGPFGGAILIGNFGAGPKFGGHINAFNDRGDFLGALRTKAGEAISIDGLWSIGSGTFEKGDPDALYFTAGIDKEVNGLLGKITAVPGRH
ncbi:MAG TPA: TIGR03118 family protein [Kofleriaceae bacterium]|nr:TIGR03118 family protein [Kofleriaceae bacterium]